ncbi:MAG: hypothetical protein Q4C72_06780 [Eubacteriales bacterium]|nr:hypothetical protein [Eubacteriales bacterium]
MQQKKQPEREPKAFPRYDEAADIDSAAVAPIPPWPQNTAQRGDPAATEYTEKYCKPEQ